jgi:geranylgeranyl pyrophosphate synthase
VKTEASTSPTTDLSWPSEWVADRGAIDAALSAAVHRCDDALGAAAPAIGFALAGEGKRIRGLLCLAAFRACGGHGDASGVAAAVEIVHAYSLVHDDLPCMDDDVMRRGRPTVHVVFGIAKATIAGVVMVPLAVQAVVDACVALHLPRETQRTIAARLMQASGAGAMVGGQLLDLRAEGRPLSLVELEAIHHGKTGALIAASAGLGALAARATAKQVDALERFGAALGLAFQVMDDVLDVTSTTATLGKTAGRDVALGKSTYPGLMGLDAARSLARRTVAGARAVLDEAELLTPDLERFSAFVVDRES